MHCIFFCSVNDIFAINLALVWAMLEQVVLRLIFYLAPLSFALLMAVLIIVRGGGGKSIQVASATSWILLAINVFAWLSNWGFQLERPYYLFLSVREVWMPLVCLVVTCIYVIAQDKGRPFWGR